MAVADDIALIVEQERALVLPRFDEEIAFAIGCDIRAHAVTAGQAIAVEIRTGERRLFYTALPGTSADNDDWLRRKANVVHRVYKSSYRCVLESKAPDDFLLRRGLDKADFVLAGGGFPIRVAHAGMIGCVTVSGLHEREDHRLVVDGLCRHLGMDPAPLTLPPL